MRSWQLASVSVIGGIIGLGCGAAPTATPPTLGVQVTSVTPTLEPNNPQLSNHGVPAEQVRFTVDGLPTPSTGLYLHCRLEIFHSGRQVGATSVVTAAAASQSVNVEVSGDNFAGAPSDAHVECSVNASPVVTPTAANAPSRSRPGRNPAATRAPSNAAA
jgi:hypothetical protein